MNHKTRNGATRTCPYCGQRSTFRERVQVPDTHVPGVPRTDAAPAPEYKSGWECDNRKCTRRYDF